MPEDKKKKAEEDKKKTKDLNDSASADVLLADPGYWKDLAQKHQEWEDGAYNRAIMSGEAKPEGIREEDIIFSTSAERLHQKTNEHREWKRQDAHSRAMMKKAREGAATRNYEEKITSEGEEKHKETKKTPVPKKETSHTNTGAAEETSYYKGKEKERKNRYVSKGSTRRIG